MYARYNICSFESMLRKSINIIGFMKGLESSTNSIICTLNNS